MTRVWDGEEAIDVQESYEEVVEILRHCEAAKGRFVELTTAAYGMQGKRLFNLDSILQVWS